MLNYVRYAVDKLAFNGMIITKTIDEMLWTYQDPLLVKLKATNPLMGGDPSILPESILLGQNQTEEQWEFVPLKFRHALNTGKRKID